MTVLLLSTVNSSQTVIYCKTLCFRCIIISRFSYVVNSLHFILANFYYRNSYRSCIHYTLPKIIAHRITQVLIFYADKLMAMSNSKNSGVFNFARYMPTQCLPTCLPHGLIC